MKKLRLLSAVCAVAIGLVMSTVVNAVVIHESATLGPTGVTFGYGIGDPTFLGSRFSITDTVSVDNVGGHLVQIEGNEGDTIFAAIISLSSSTALPTGSPFNTSELMASTTFSIPFLSDDVLTPLSVTLAPGDYALIFGSDLFGANGTGAMPNNNSDISGSASYFWWNGSNWSNTSFNVGDLRFVVTGTVVPIPAAVWLFGSGLLGLVGIARRRRKTSSPLQQQPQRSHSPLRGPFHRHS